MPAGNDTRQRFTNIGDYLSHVGTNISNHGTTFAISVIVGLGVVFVTTWYFFRNYRRDVPDWAHKTMTAITAIGLVFTWIGFVQLIWWFKAEPSGALPLPLSGETIQNKGDFWKYGAGILPAAAIVMAVTMFLRLRFAIVAWAPAVLAIFGLTLVVNFISTLINV